jgi:flagellar L-ring protein precursor FlgH
MEALLVALAAGLVWSAGATPVAAQSLWNYRQPGKAFMFYDSQARSVGDPVTIVINETTDVENTDERALDRSDSSSGSFNFSGSSGGDLPLLAGSANMTQGAGSQGQQAGRAMVSVDREFNDRITALVVDILPNGNLVVEGVRHRVVTGERRTLRVSGIIRPVDIEADNTIDSQYVANFTMFYAGDGRESHFTMPSWLSRTLNRFRVHRSDPGHPLHR